MNRNTELAIFIFTVWAVLLTLTLWSEGAFADENYFYAKAGLGHNAMLFSDNEWEDQGKWGGALGFGYRHIIAGNWHGELSYTHYSQPAAGGPQNNDYEDTLDAFYYYIEYRW